jgi:hypothetical protein
MANFEGQLESCVKQLLQPEVLGLGEVPPLGDLHGVVQQPGVLGLRLGVVQAVQYLVKLGKRVLSARLLLRRTT